MKKISCFGVLSISIFLLIVIALNTEDTNDSSHFNSNSNPHTNTKPKQIKKWFQGGNLHEATVTQWREAMYENKLATAGDWLASTKWKGYLNSPEDFEKAKLKAKLLVKCVDLTISETQTNQIDNQKVNEIAAGLFILSDEFGPY